MFLISEIVEVTHNYSIFVFKASNVTWLKKWMNYCQLVDYAKSFIWGYRLIHLNCAGNNPVSTFYYTNLISGCTSSCFNFIILEPIRSRWNTVTNLISCQFLYLFTFRFPRKSFIDPKILGRPSVYVYVWMMLKRIYSLNLLPSYRGHEIFQKWL